MPIIYAKVISTVIVVVFPDHSIVLQFTIEWSILIAEKGLILKRLQSDLKGN
jgi:hypothetical protein